MTSGDDSGRTTTAVVDRASTSVLGPLATAALSGAGFAALAGTIVSDPDGVGRVSRERYDLNVTTPADYAFSIWGPIYTGLGALAVHQALPAQADNPRYAAARPWLAAIPAANAAWIALTLRERTDTANGLLLGLWGTAYGLHRALGIGSGPAGSAAERAFRVPASLYLGWLTLAVMPTAVNVALDRGFEGTPETRPLWGAAAVTGAAAAGAALARRLNDPGIGATFVWGLAGVAARHATGARDSKRRAEGSRSTGLAVLAGALALGGAALLARRALRLR